MAHENEDGLARSQRYRALKADPTWRALSEDTIGELFREWVTTEPHDTAARERLYQTALAIRCLEDRLNREAATAERREAEVRVARDEADRQARAEADRRERGGNGAGVV